MNKLRMISYHVRMMLAYMMFPEGLVQHDDLVNAFTESLEFIHLSGKYNQYCNWLVNYKRKNEVI